MTFDGKHIHDKLRAFFARMTFGRWILLFIMTITLCGEIITPFAMRTDEYVLERTLLYEPTHSEGNGKQANALLGDSVDVWIDVKVVPHYNSLHTVGTIRINEADYEVNEYCFYPITPLFKFGNFCYEMIEFVRTRTAGFSRWRITPKFDIETPDMSYAVYIDRDHSINMIVYTEEASACYHRNHINQHVQQTILPKK